jgi:hypothetical protein
MKSSAPASGEFVRLTCNTIFSGKWYDRGDPVPAANLPQNLKRYIEKSEPAEPEPEPDPDTPASLNFQLGTLYHFDSDGNHRRLRHLERQTAELIAQTEREEALAEEWQHANDHLDPATLADLEASHSASIQHQIAQAEVDARRTELAQEEGQKWNDEQTEAARGYDLTASPPPEEEWHPSEPKPRKMKVRFLRRGAVWCRAKKVKPKAGESVWIKQDGEYVQIGTVNRQWPVACFALHPTGGQLTMATFRLTKKAQNAVRTTFHVIDDASGDIVGSINVGTGQEADDLLRCWQGATDSPQQQKQSSPNNVLAQAFLKNRQKFSRAALLRTC